MSDSSSESAEVSPEQAKLARKAATASLVGTAIEWYDFFIFGTASALVFGVLFFPSEDPIYSTLAALAVFGVGFFIRPVGGLVFGHLGDRFGRKRALVATLLIMGVATFLIGLLPTVEQIGVAAPILLVVLRLLQGFGVGGEWGGATLVAVEYAPPSRRGAYGSFPQIGNALGLVAATGIFLLVSQLPDEDLFAWGWRIPFLLSAVLVVVGLVIRVALTETPVFEAAKQELLAKKAGDVEAAEERVPLVELFRSSRRPIFLAMGMRLSESVLGNVLLVIMLAFATTYTDIERGDVLAAVTVAATFGIFTCYLAGSLSDRVGRRKVFIFGAVVGLVASYPIFLLIDANSVVGMYVITVVVYCFGVQAMYAVESSFFSELFPTRVRYSALSVVTQLPSVLIGLWPMTAAALLIATDGNPWLVAVVTMLLMAIGVVCAVLTPETNRLDLNRISQDSGVQAKAGRTS